MHLRTITVTGVEDFNIDGTQSTNINISYSSSDTTDGIHGQSSSFAVNVTDSGKGATTITSAVAEINKSRLVGLDQQLIITPSTTQRMVQHQQQVAPASRFLVALHRLM